MDQGETRGTHEMLNEGLSLLSVNHNVYNETRNSDVDSKGLKGENEVSLGQNYEPKSGDSILKVSVSKANCVSGELKEEKRDHWNLQAYADSGRPGKEREEGVSGKTHAHKFEHVNSTEFRSDCPEELLRQEQLIDSTATDSIVSPNSSSLSLNVQPVQLDQHNQHHILSIHQNMSTSENESNAEMSSATSSSLESVVSYSHIDGNISSTASCETSNTQPMQSESFSNNTIACTSLKSALMPRTNCSRPTDSVSQVHIPQSMSPTLQPIDTYSDGHISTWSPLMSDTEKQVICKPSNSLKIETSSTKSLATNIASSSLPRMDEDGAEKDKTFSESISQSSIKVENPELDNSDTDGLESDTQEDSSVGGSTSQGDAPFKILTKYVYINKPPKPKTGKKKLGLLYKQAFRHFHRSKLNSQPHPKKIPSNTDKQHSTKRNAKKLMKETTKTWKRREVASMNKEKVKSERKKERKTKPAVKKTKEKSSTPVTVRLKDTAEPRRSQRGAGKTTSSVRQKSGKKQQGRKKTKKAKLRKYLLLSEKLDVINQLENPLTSIESLAEHFNTDTKVIKNIFKEKKDILQKMEAKAERKRRSMEKKQAKRNSIKIPVIKEERLDEDMNEEETVTQFDSMDDSQVSAKDLKHSHPCTSSKETKSRNELTLLQKVSMIYDLEKPGAKVKHIARKFGVSTSAVSRIRRQKDHILSRSLSGDVCQDMKRTRECKDPILDRALLKWYRALEALQPNPISVANTLLVEKSKDIAIAMGKTYFPGINWIIRWKYRHNIVTRSGRIESKEALDELDANIDMEDIITAAEGQMISPDLQASIKIEKTEKMIVCEHCGIMTHKSRRNKRRNHHLKSCPLSAQTQRRDLTLGEKAQVARALEKPGMKMVTLAKKYGVSSSSISRIHKNRVDILARCAGNYVNVGRKRDRGSKEPEVERLLCDWYHTQQEFGYHVSSTMVREKAKDIAAGMGKDFWPSDSWVFRWRHRNNVNALSGFEEIDDDEVEEILKDENNEEDEAEVNEKEVPEMEAEAQENDSATKGKKRKRKRKKDLEEGETGQKIARIQLPTSVMCEKCGCVSARLKNNRIRNIRHAKGCPDLKPRNELTYEERVRMLRALEEPGATLSSVARQFGVSASSMSRMNQKKDSIMSFGVGYAGQKRIRDCKEPEVAKLLYSWFMERQKEGIHVTGTKLKEKAASLAREMGREFKASTGWLGRWKHRYNVLFRKDDTKPRKEIAKKRPLRKKANGQSIKSEEVMEAQVENHQDSVSGNESVMTIQPDPSQPFQTPRMFLNQRYQTPWSINPQPPPTSCARSKEFIAPPNHGVPEENHVPYAYDPMPRHMFQNMFENFSSTAGYPVSMVEPSVPVRDYLPQDEHEAPHPSSSHHHIIPHQPPPLNLHTTGLVQPHSSHAQQTAPIHNPSHSPGPPVSEEDNIQQQQIMEAYKLMNSFAKEKSLGEHVQAALRTIEITLKNNERKGAQRNTYTNI